MPSEKSLTQAVLQVMPRLKLLYLFGSFATETETSESDIDLAFYSEEALEPEAVYDLAQTLAVSLRRDVDLVNLAYAPTVLQMQIVNSGRLLFCEDKAFADAFEGRILSMYLRFQEERKAILSEIQRRGSVYG